MFIFNIGPTRNASHNKHSLLHLVSRRKHWGKLMSLTHRYSSVSSHNSLVIKQNVRVIGYLNKHHHQQSQTQIIVSFPQNIFEAHQHPPIKKQTPICACPKINRLDTFLHQTRNKQAPTQRTRSIKLTAKTPALPNHQIHLPTDPPLSHQNTRIHKSHEQVSATE